MCIGKTAWCLIYSSLLKQNSSRLWWSFWTSSSLCPGIKRVFVCKESRVVMGLTALSPGGALIFLVVPQGKGKGDALPLRSRSPRAAS